MAERLIYLYCISQKEPNLKDSGSGNDVYSIFHNGLYAVASRVSKGEFSEENLKKNLANLEWIKEKASMHEKIIEGVMKGGCVIPFKFGTIFNTEGNLKAVLGERAKEFKEDLKNLEGKEEWGVKVYCDLKRLKESIVKEEAEVVKIEKEIESSSPGRAYLLTKKKEEMIKNALNERINRYGQESFKILEVLSVRTRINKLLPKEVTERKDDMILNAAFLVDKNKVGEFIKMAGVLKTKFTDKGLSFDCTGPWPPYNFCQRDVIASPDKGGAKQSQK